MRKYLVVKMFGGIKGAENVKAGCLIGVDEDEKTVGTFDTEEEARAELNKLTHDVQNLNSGNLYRVTDYCIRIEEQDEDGEYIGSTVDYITKEWSF